MLTSVIMSCIDKKVPGNLKVRRLFIPCSIIAWNSVGGAKRPNDNVKAWGESGTCVAITHKPKTVL